MAGDDLSTWFATSEALTRFDVAAENWQRVAPASGSPILPTALAADGKGGVWIGSVRGLHHIAADGQSVRDLVAAKPALAPVNAILPIKSSASLLLGTDAGLRLYDSSTGSLTAPPGDDSLVGSIQSLAMDGLGQIWIGTSDGAWVMAGLQGQAERVDELAGWAVNALLGSREGGAWLGTSRGLWQATGSPVVARPVPAGPHSEDPVLALAEDGGGRVWAGAWTGLFRLSGEERGLEEIRLPSSRFAAIPALLSSSRGELWVGSTEGLFRGGLDSPWANLTNLAPPEPDTAVAAVSCDSEGTVWAATLGDGLWRLDTRSGAWVSYEGRPGLPAAEIRALSSAPSGETWAATTDGVTRFGGAIVTFPFPISIEGEGRVWLASNDSSDAFVATSRGTIFRREGTTGAWLQLASPPAGATVKSFALSAGGVPYLATSVGLLRYRVDADRWMRVNTKIGADRELVVEEIAPWGDSFAVVTSDPGALYLMDEDSALHPILSGGLLSVLALGAAGDELRVVTAQGGYAIRMDGVVRSLDGLPEDVTSLAADARGWWWYGTSSGLWYSVSREAEEVFAVGRTPRRHAVDQSGRLLLTQGSVVARGASVTSPTERSLAPLRVLARAEDGDPLPEGVSFSAVATDLEGGTWLGTQLSGLVYDTGTHALWIRAEDGLLSNEIVDIRVVNGRTADEGASSIAWVLTRRGVVRVEIELAGSSRPRLAQLRTLGSGAVQDLPAGAPSHISAMPGGGVVLGYQGGETGPGSVSSAPTLALVDGDLGVRVLEPSSDGSFEQRRMLGLTASDDRVWIATNAGLWAASADEGYELEGVRGINLPMSAWTAIALAPDRPDELWLASAAVDGQGPSLVSFDTRQRRATLLTLPARSVAPITSLAFDGPNTLLAFSEEDVYLARLSGGWKRSGWALFAGLTLTVVGLTANSRSRTIRALRSEPLKLLDQPIGSWGPSLLRLLLSGGRREFLDGLGISGARYITLLRLSLGGTRGRIKGLAHVLGGSMISPPLPAAAGTTIATLQIDQPRQLKDKLVLVVALPSVIDDPARLRSEVRAEVRRRGLSELAPVWLLCARKGDAREARELGQLELDERTLGRLLLASSPAQTLAGLLHVSGTLLTSPYRHGGSVSDPSMFFGRERQLALMLERGARLVVTGPRRAGKTSLVERVARQVSETRLGCVVAVVDLLGIRDPQEAERRIVTKLCAAASASHGEPKVAVSLDEFAHLVTGREVVLLLDEVDGVVEADAQAGHELLLLLRRLGNGRDWSVILVGFRFLYRQSLDQESPLFNFGTTMLVGPLEQEAALELATIPMERMGVRYDAQQTAEELVRLAGASAYMIQLICDLMLQSVSADTLLITREILTGAVNHSSVEDWIARMIHANSEGLRPVLHALAEVTAFTSAEVRASAFEVGLDPVDIEAELQVRGFIRRRGNSFTWAMPLIQRGVLRDKGTQDLTLPTESAHGP